MKSFVTIRVVLFFVCFITIVETTECFAFEISVSKDNQYFINGEINSYLQDNRNRTNILFPEDSENRISEEKVAALRFEGEILGFFWRYRFEYKKEDENDYDTDSVLQEFSRTFSLTDSVELVAGKRMISWSVGYSFTPLGFFQKEVDALDITDRFGVQEGVPLLAAAYFLDNVDIVVVASNDFEDDPDGFNKGVRQVGLKLNTAIDDFSLSIVMQQPENQKTGIGTSLTYAWANNTLGVGFHGSCFLREGTRRPLHKQIYEKEIDFATADPYDDYRLTDGKLYPRWVLGSQITFEDDLEIILEISHDERGLNNEQWDHFLSMIDFHKEAQQLPGFGSISKLNIGFDSLTFEKLRARQDYFFARVSKKIESWSLNQLFIIGIADESYISSTSVNYRFNDDLDFEISINQFVGSENSEFGLYPLSSSLRSGVVFLF